MLAVIAIARLVVVIPHREFGQTVKNRRHWPHDVLELPPRRSETDAGRARTKEQAFGGRVLADSAVGMRGVGGEAVERDGGAVDIKTADAGIGRGANRETAAALDAHCFGAGRAAVRSCVEGDESTVINAI